ncbi:MAG TPA: phosphate ABC transporter permease PstA [Termitinemataceae bacterium]|uniref:phosphate ABC transporter permease PstA n=1 Tax=Treponema sp. J25 TaxID=2094121 RepID=UPI001045CB80|nr:phosphate ABC transporter permease PstA [Treponema sp. J25]TCW62584.1 phosphate ABC transporter permease PtsA [Treponema sp. J25]HOJ98267.1 phosphate ABC transporter permease PstA [Termitinemataceae bacterium]HOM22631.1 phosphate ABC transporter permease PstA [Termitinemataceae bacterium]HPP99470.1 phosphate ABC transporter permease PstA [Termitinemataceae bacterium]
MKQEFDLRLEERQKKGKRWLTFFMIATLFSIFALTTLLVSIVNNAFGYVALENKINPEDLSQNGVPLENLPKETLVKIIQQNISRRLFIKLDNEKPFVDRSNHELLETIEEEVINPQVRRTWSLWESITQYPRIREWQENNFPQGRLVFRSWINWNFVVSSQEALAIHSGIRGALIGSFLTILIAILIAFPIGIGAAIYLEEYATDTALNRFIQLNIYNLAGVPSIIYGMLGLAVFVRYLEPVTSGALFGVLTDNTVANGRTILSAGLTLGILILPTIIINAQEAFKAVPNSLRHSSLSVGATTWQTIWHHVLPVSIDRILTGTVLAISRAIGETAPLVVVGASAFLTQDPSGIFSKFTTLPIVIYQWTSRPQIEWKNAAAAAIIVLLILLLSLNATAIILRNKYRKEKRLA